MVNKVQGLVIVSSITIVCLIIFSVSHGAIEIGWRACLSAAVKMITDNQSPDVNDIIIQQIRLPRCCLAIFVGANLSLSGVLCQGLFRNELADASVIGVTSGSALAGGLTLCLATRWIGEIALQYQTWIIPLSAFCGGLITAVLIYVVGGKTNNTTTVLLAGVAISAFAGAGLGLMNYLADNQQIKALSVWNIGSCASANWISVAIAGVTVTILLYGCMSIAREMDVWLLGEVQAEHLGISAKKFQVTCMVLAALAAGVSIALTGVIGFVGLIVPHITRRIIGAEHQLVIPCSVMIGGVLLLAADTFARLLIPALDIPVGIVTAFLGSPFFIWILKRKLPYV